MNTYDDYTGFIFDNKELINKLSKSSPLLYDSIKYAIRILDYITDEAKKGNEIDNILDEIFYLAYGYLSNIVSDLQSYYKDYFNEDFNKFNIYADVIHYNLYLDDLRCFMEQNSEYTPLRKEQFEKVESEIQEILSKKLPITGFEVSNFDEELFQVIPRDYEYQPTYYVFYQICEVLDLYK